VVEPGCWSRLELEGGKERGGHRASGWLGLRRRRGRCARPGPSREVEDEEEDGGFFVRRLDLKLTWMVKRKQRLIHKSSGPKAKYSKKTGGATVDWEDEDACGQSNISFAPITDLVASP
jgi:hypothetical protein